MGNSLFGQAQPGQQSPFMTLLPLILIFVVFYFLLILPQQRKQKEMKKMLDGLKPGDKVLTVGGQIGRVEKIRENVITLKIAENVTGDFVRNAIAQVLKDS